MKNYSLLMPALLFAGVFSTAGAAVSVVENGGDLEIQGDGSADAIRITQGGSGDEFVVRGLEAADGSTTLVNGNIQVVIDDVDDDIEVDLAEGNDRLVVNGVTVPDKLRVELGRDNDRFVVRNANIAGDLTFFGEDGNDVAIIKNSYVAEDANLETGDGDDRLRLLGNTFNDEVEIDLKDGNDVLVLENNLFEDDFQANGDSGNNLLKDRGGNSFGEDVDFEDF